MSRSVLFAFAPKDNDRLVVICPGRIESYVKYAELAYDLFHSGFDVMIIGPIAARGVPGAY
ncbi:lysophospholipase L2 [Raoultella planticola]|uniref:Lysophospholipase L2 n=1 Tax=Raoultella planticola TaxID=575 RepID=A0A485BF80_RAOPL|nr:lysophospholipase L2 [Raoultella planticola]